MSILSYLGPFALVPLLVAKDDAEIQWHARHGLVLFGAEIVLSIAMTIVGSLGPLACLVAIAFPLIALGLLGLHVFLIVKAINGERFLIPGLSELADRF